MSGNKQEAPWKLPPCAFMKSLLEEERLIGLLSLQWIIPCPRTCLQWLAVTLDALRLLLRSDSMVKAWADLFAIHPGCPSWLDPFSGRLHETTPASGPIQNHPATLPKARPSLWKVLPLCGSTASSSLQLDFRRWRFGLFCAQLCTFYFIVFIFCKKLLTVVCCLVPLQSKLSDWGFKCSFREFPRVGSMSIHLLLAAMRELKLAKKQTFTWPDS